MVEIVVGSGGVLELEEKTTMLMDEVVTKIEPLEEAVENLEKDNEILAQSTISTFGELNEMLKKQTQDTQALIENFHDMSDWIQEVSNRNSKNKDLIKIGFGLIIIVGLACFKIGMGI